MKNKRKVWRPYARRGYYVYCYGPDKKQTLTFLTWLDEKVAAACINAISKEFGFDIRYIQTNRNNRLRAEVGEYSEDYLSYRHGDIVWFSGDDKCPAWTMPVKQITKKFLNNLEPLIQVSLTGDQPLGNEKEKEATEQDLILAELIKNHTI